MRLSTLCVLTMVGCATSNGGIGADPDFASDADTNLKAGREALESKNYVEAEKFFEYVRAKYPYLEVANEAELLLADLDFDREQWADARDRYQAFVKAHPTHAKVDDAAYRAALTLY